ncbi:hypothetical protein OTBS_1601 [Orientia tsutsugamushi str. Boryong]|uniref:Uncharacterized protein n=1 Tax=Orientia tsutsugamushi (strain Boryong) TaxID=357244 RepID=A5CEQ7_ORITB|nr:hypothetical protein OTBS_1601 [Orientia tsutsugamushi str. Boryong]
MTFYHNYEKFFIFFKVDAKLSHCISSYKNIIQKRFIKKALQQLLLLALRLIFCYNS